MRILFVWLTALILCSTITIGWYIGLTVITGVASAIIGDVGSGQGLALLTLVEYVAIGWAPVFDFFIIIWAIISSQARDVESEIYR
ncbi:MAG: hypothetical protein ACXACY_26515 [Candidatus Hodarchaeales archaeon]|jgi:hypothetical protein